MNAPSLRDERAAALQAAARLCCRAEWSGWDAGLVGCAGPLIVLPGCVAGLCCRVVLLGCVAGLCCRVEWSGWDAGLVGCAGPLLVSLGGGPPARLPHVSLRLGVVYLEARPGLAATRRHRGWALQTTRYRGSAMQAARCSGSAPRPVTWSAGGVQASGCSCFGRGGCSG